ncbi:hypothetical protein [Desulfopila sp. IMCC35008]|uniref:hypothetical protein n=1 Tax=Desulfopila sp. IMCC35008 TaxID=2653858 RepID=UPI0013D88566|nr:hypothetical protein [Desulfopila sp. IMCC35008]
MRNCILVLLMMSVTLAYRVPQANGGELPVIEWKVFYIQAIYNKPGTGEGFADELFRFYQEHLPEYSHQAEGMPIKRIFHDMANTHSGIYCCPGKTPVSPELKGKVIPSNSSLELAPPGIVVRQRDIATLFSRGENVSVADLIENKGLRTSWVRGATYHPEIRNVIERNEERPNVTMQATVIGEFQEMLLRGNIDFYVSHALDFTWHSNNNPKVRDELAFLQVAEAPGTVSTLAFCNNTPEGREVISKINDLLLTDEYRIFRDDLIKRYYPASLVGHFLELHKKPLPENVWPE